MNDFLIDLVKSVLVQLVCDAIHKYSEPPKHYGVDIDGISASMDITEEDLKYLKEIATKEQVNSFLTMEIKIEQTILKEGDKDGK